MQVNNFNVKPRYNHSVNINPNHFIYILCEPEDRIGSKGRFYKKGEVRYVGLSTIGHKRTRAHNWTEKQQKYGHTRLYSWINSLQRKNQKYIVEVVEDGFGDSAEEIKRLEETEQFYMDYFRSLGFNLVNTAPAGYGTYWTGKKQTPEFVEKRVKSLRGRTRTEEFRKNASNRMLGNRPSKETIEKNRQNQKKRGPISEETRKKLSNVPKRGPQLPVIDSYGVEYKSRRAAAKANNTTSGSIKKSILEQKPIPLSDKVFKYKT